jgi:tetratricopeptide (TPR) repeat protein/DNA-binding CsgD family transcriptional regulator
VLKKTFFFSTFFILNVFFLFCQETEQYNENTLTIDKTFIALNENLKNELTSDNQKAIAEAHLELGVFCQENGVFIEAINQFNTALSILKNKIHDTLYLNLLNRLGAIHLDLKNYDTAENYFQKGIIDASELHNNSQLACSKSNLGICFEKKGNYIKALELQKESLELYDSLQEQEGLSIVNENIGSIYEDLEKYNLAQEYFEKSLYYHKNSKDARRANILNNLGDVFRKTGVLDKGLLYTGESLSIAKEIKNKREEASAYKDLAENHQFLGELNEAYIFLNKYILLDKANDKQQSANQATALQVIYDSKEKESQIHLLLQNSKVDKAQNRLLLVSIVGFFVLVFLWYLYILKKRKQTKQELVYKEQILKAELEKKQSEEQNLQSEVSLKNASLSRYSLHLSQKNKMLSNLSQTLKNCLERTNVDLKRKLNQLIKEIDFNLSQEDEWDEFMVLFKEIHPKFIQKINKVALDNLSPAELRLSILLRLSLSSKEIASILRLTPDSVRVSRYRLRKKLPIHSKEELSAFLLTI